MYRYYYILSPEQISFICDEFHLTQEELFAQNETESDRLYDMLGDIEAEETMRALDSELSGRGKIVEEIITRLGNELARREGYLDIEE